MPTAAYTEVMAAIVAERQEERRIARLSGHYQFAARIDREIGERVYGAMWFGVSRNIPHKVGGY